MNRVGEVLKAEIIYILLLFPLLFYFQKKKKRIIKLVRLVRLITGIQMDESYSSFKNMGHCVHLPW